MRLRGDDQRTHSPSHSSGRDPRRFLGTRRHTQPTSSGERVDSRSVIGASLEHRRFLDPSAPVKPIADAGLFTRIGGQQAIDALVDGLYDGLEHDGVLRPLFGRDLARDRANQKLSLIHI